MGLEHNSFVPAQNVRQQTRSKNTLSRDHVSSVSTHKIARRLDFRAVSVWSLKDILGHVVGSPRIEYAMLALARVLRTKELG